MRFLLLFLPILIFLNTLPALDPSTYKFTIVEGEPVTLNASDTIQVSSFEECTEKCEKDPVCIMAYQANSSDPCYLFAWNSVQEVKKNESGGVGTVAFKVYTDQPSCELNSPFLMNGKIYPLFPNDTSNFLWKIDTSEGGWKITYIEKRQEESLICGNFTYNRPYSDGCNPECLMTMVQLNAEPGPISYRPNTSPGSSWLECLYQCHNNSYCFAVYFQDGVSTNCTWYEIQDIWFMNRTEVTEGKHMGMKIPLSNRSCKLTTDQLMNDQYYLVDWTVILGGNRLDKFFRVRTTPKYYKIQMYLNEGPQITRQMPGCEVMTVPSTALISHTPSDWKGNPVVCMRLQPTPGGITYAAAKEICNEWDGKLMTERIQGFVQICHTILPDPGMPWGWLEPWQPWGFRGIWKERDLKIWMGLEKDQSSGQFKWQAPEWSITNGFKYFQCNKESVNVLPSLVKDEDAVRYTANSVAMTWGPGQPDMKPGQDCAYLLHKLKQGWPGYGHYTATCDTELADGFLCGTPRQMDKGIPTYRSMQDEYGID